MRGNIRVSLVEIGWQDRMDLVAVCCHVAVFFYADPSPAAGLVVAK